MGKLGGNADLLAQTVFGQDLTQRCLAAGVDVGRVKIVDARLDGGQNESLGLFHVDAAHGLGEAHTAKAEDGERIALSVGTVVHGRPPISKITVIIAVFRSECNEREHFQIDYLPRLG